MGSYVTEVSFQMVISTKTSLYLGSARTKKAQKHKVMSRDGKSLRLRGLSLSLGTIIA